MKGRALLDVEQLRATIRTVPDFPKPGIQFRDITTLLADPAALHGSVALLAEHARASGATVIAGMEARGFILAPPVALALGAGFVPVRKAGKLPRETHAVSYDLEYGSATLELHRDAVRPGDRVLLVDDVLATGGTARATAELVQACGAVVVGVAVLMDLAFLPWRAALGDVEVTSLLTVE